MIRLSELSKKYLEDPRERNLQALFRSMAAAGPEVTLEKLIALPYDISRVLQETVLNASFCLRRRYPSLAQQQQRTPKLYPKLTTWKRLEGLADFRYNYC